MLLSNSCAALHHQYSAFPEKDPADITAAIRSGKVAYLVNTRDPSSTAHMSAGREMRRLAIENGLTTFTSLDTVRALKFLRRAASSV